ncbi:MAG TPA: ABC transporter ATP-binding protein, partial [Terriglobales bacterium]|nr:ABC transporter ATP-binding protein [Terriglobales bacterium]
MSSAPKLTSKGSPRPQLKAVLPLVWELVRPRRALLVAGFALMAVNRVASLVLPYSTRYLIDSVVVKHHVQLLRPIISAVLAATVVQGITSFSLTQLLSKAAQRLIAELRQKVQAHVERLPVAYHDSTKSGVLVSRIMSDVEGVRNLIGTGLVDLCGGFLTAAIALVVLFRISALMTVLAFGFLALFALA